MIIRLIAITQTQKILKHKILASIIRLQLFEDIINIFYNQITQMNQNLPLSSWKYNLLHEIKS